MDLPKISEPLKSQSHRFWLNLIAPLNIELYEEDVDLKIIQLVMKIINSHKKILWIGGKKKYKNNLQLTKLAPFETSHLLRSELNEVASENILL